jgi:hypothetical protein
MRRSSACAMPIQQASSRQANRNLCGIAIT